ncbi:MAG: small multi-drug export protein [Ruminococcaceae bacterium]|nr:small multi-drug export protein [Oscillospiraceae bacterium]
MTDAIVTFFQNMNISDELVVFLVSMLPIIELRGAIPLGFFMDIEPWVLFIITVIGNILPVPFIILCARPIVNFCLRTRFLRPVGNWMEEKVRKNSHKVLQYEIFGLFLFVAIPLPGTGAWTGALIATFLDLRLKNAVPSIIAGVMGAGIIMIFGSSIVKFLVGLF